MGNLPKLPHIVWIARIYMSVLRDKYDNNNYQAQLLNYYEVNSNNTSTKDCYYRRSTISDKIQKVVCTRIITFRKCRLYENWQFVQEYH